MMVDYLKLLPHSFIGSGDKNKTITITAGIDGDEYASIEAAYRLIEILKKTKINGKVNVFPIVNVSGFENVSSINPVDNKYPKYIFPGDPNGSDSEKLIYFLVENYIKKSSMWIDLHGGGITEYLEPYIYSYETKSSDNKLTLEVVHKLNVEKLVLGKPGWWDMTETLSKLGVTYFILESGYAGKRNKEFIDKHIEWVIDILKINKTIQDGEKLQNIPKIIYRNVFEYEPEVSGLWFPEINKELHIKKNQKIGEIRDYDNKLIKIIKSPYNGEILYITKGLLCEKGSPLFGIGYEEEDFDNL